MPSGRERPGYRSPAEWRWDTQEGRDDECPAMELPPVKSADRLKRCSDSGCDRDDLPTLVMWYITMRITKSARRHGVSDEAIRHAVTNAIRLIETDDGVLPSAPVPPGGCSSSPPGQPRTVTWWCFTRCIYDRSTPTGT
jgi:hypothetical protein